MDALAAFSLLCNVIQIVDFGLKTISRCREIALRGSLTANLDTEYTIGHLKGLSKDVQSALSSSPTTTSPVSRSDRQLLELAHKCELCAQELADKLQRLKIDKSKGGFKAATKILEILWKRGDVKDVENRLETLRKTLDTVTLARICNVQNLETLRQRTDFDTLNQVSKDIYANLLSGHKIVVGLISVEHEKTRDLIHRETQAIQSVISLDGTETRLLLVNEGNKNKQDIQLQVIATGKKVMDLQNEIQKNERKLGDLKSSLWFSTMSTRQQMIVSAHESTFEWMLGIKNTSRSSKPLTQKSAYEAALSIRYNVTDNVFNKGKGWNTNDRYNKQPSYDEKRFMENRRRVGEGFVNWLKSGSRIYWISGKPGSGKSTLMLVIMQHVDTMIHSKSWAGTAQLLTPAFFFWNSGSPEQKSVSGFLRSLIYQCLEACPALINPLSNIFIDRSATTNDFGANPLQIPLWTTGRLIEAMNGIIGQTEIPCRFCIFVDGLDELEGSFQELLQLLGVWGTISNVKLCVSSRPLYDFASAFKHATTIRLEDLTMMDMITLVEDRLLTRVEWERLDGHSSALQALQLRLDLVEKAEGVFLWLILALRELEQGLQYMDSLEQLQERLQSLPDDINEMYIHIIGKIPKVYRKQSSGFLRNVFLSARLDSSLSILLLALMNDSTLLAIFVDDQNIENTLDAYQRALPLIAAKCEEVNVHLKTRCAGLLDVTIVRENTLPLHGSRLTKAVLGWWSHRVSFLHRTLRDFLLETEAGAELLGDVSTLQGSMLESQAISLLTALGILIIEGINHSGLIDHTSAHSWQKQNSFLEESEGHRLTRFLNRILGSGEIPLERQFHIFHLFENLFGALGKSLNVDMFEVYHSARKRTLLFFKEYDFGPQVDISGHAAWIGCTEFVLEKLNERPDLIIQSQTQVSTYLLSCTIDGLRSCLQNNRAFPVAYEVPSRLITALLVEKADPNALCKNARNQSNSFWHHYLAALCSIPYSRQDQPKWDYAAVMEALILGGADVCTPLTIDHKQHAWEYLRFAIMVDLGFGGHGRMSFCMSPLGALSHFVGHMPWFVSIERILLSSGAEISKGVEYESMSRGIKGAKWCKLTLNEEEKLQVLSLHSKYIRLDDGDRKRNSLAEEMSDIVHHIPRAQDIFLLQKPRTDLLHSERTNTTIKGDLNSSSQTMDGRKLREANIYSPWKQTSRLSWQGTNNLSRSNISKSSWHSPANYGSNTMPQAMGISEMKANHMYSPSQSTDKLSWEDIENISDESPLKGTSEKIEFHGVFASSEDNNNDAEIQSTSTGWNWDAWIEQKEGSNTASSGKDKESGHV